MNLTDNERILLESINKGMDYPGEGWLHEITPFENPHVMSGTIGSLIEKKLVTSNKDLTQPILCYWVAITDDGKKLCS
jgi:hypothetical protein